MAKTLFGAIVVDARNKLGGHVFSKNKAGSFMRRKVSPAQPRTSAQLAIRADMTTLSKAWGGSLSESERAAWTAFALNNPTRDQFGNVVQLTGAQTYNRLNQQLLYAGYPRIDTPPTSLEVAGIEGFAAIADNSAQSLILSALLPIALKANEVPMLWATRQLSPGVNSLSSFFRFLATFPTAEESPLAITAAPTGAVRVSNVTTILPTVAHDFQPGDSVIIAGVTDPTFNGTFTVQTIATTVSFTVSNTGADATSGAGTVAAVRDVGGLYIDKFGALETGNILGVGLRVLNTTTGAQSPLFTLRIPVIA